MSNLNIDHLRSWVGKERVENDLIDARQARLMAATFDHPVAQMKEGDALPALWHWAYFLEGLPPGELGRDGHPARGSFLPPVPLPNRMWAGGAFTFHERMVIGSHVERRSRIASVEEKQGKTGSLIFVRVRHEMSSESRLLITEDHDIVYTGPRNAAEKADLNSMSRRVSLGDLMDTYTPTSTTLFRYSALTFNGHRIHYDLNYCQIVEGYPNLVVHGPLNATLLANHAQKSGAELASFRYRGVRPAFLGSEIGLYSSMKGEDMQLHMALSTGEVVMSAECSFA